MPNTTLAQVNAQLATATSVATAPKATVTWPYGYGSYPAVGNTACIARTCRCCPNRRK